MDSSRRRFERIRPHIRNLLSVSIGGMHACSVRDISYGGFSIDWPADEEIEEKELQEITLHLGEISVPVQVNVAYRARTYLGLAFDLLPVPPFGYPKLMRLIRCLYQGATLRTVVPQGLDAGMDRGGIVSLTFRGEGPCKLILAEKKGKLAFASLEWTALGCAAPIHLVFEKNEVSVDWSRPNTTFLRLPSTSLDMAEILAQAQLILGAVSLAVWEDVKVQLQAVIAREQRNYAPATFREQQVW